MRVYGDRSRVADPRAVLRLLGRRRAVQGPDGLVGALILAGELAQGLADAEFEAKGFDDLSPVQDAANALVLAVAAAVHRSWTSGLTGEPPDMVTEIATLAGLDLPRRVTLKQGEGFAFYAVYPEAYLEAARRLTEQPIVIGLRSIGTALAACVAAASGARRVLTLRPVGQPFDRRPRTSARLATEVVADSQATFAIVDEGPGLSGSSFGGVADWLVEQGVARERIVFFPSHAGEPGPEAGPDRRGRWRAARREVATFDDLFLGRDSAAPLQQVFQDLTGRAAEPPLDLSGGDWRSLAYAREADWPPVQAGQERRKILLRGARGAFLVKFAGLGLAGAAKMRRARALHAAGFTPEPLALRHGLLCERWRADSAPLPADAPLPVERIADYIRFRAERFPSPRAGASLAELHAMGEANTREALGEAAVTRWRRWSADGLASLQSRARPAYVDGRMHRWEWLRTPDGLLKSDALDHACAHDLVGPQDAAWDVAGAAVEFDLDAADVADLLARTDVDAELLALMTPCYLAFQLGAWTFAAASAADEGRSEMQRGLYMRKLARWAGSAEG